MASSEIPLGVLLEKLRITTYIPFELAYSIYAFVLTIVKDSKQVVEADHLLCADKDCGMALVSDHKIYRDVTNKNLLISKLMEWEAGNIQGSVPKKLLENVYDIAKRQLTSLSIDFLIDKAKHLSNQHTYTMLKLTKRNVKELDEIPDFYSLTAVFQVSIQKQIPVLLKIRKCLHEHRFQETTPFDIALYLVPNANGNFDVKPLPHGMHHQPVIVVESKRSGQSIAEESTEAYKARLFKNFDFLLFCEMDGAQHKQYTSDDDSLLQKPSEVIPLLAQPEFAAEAFRLDALKDKAKAVGCSFHNQTLILLSHLFADTIGRQRTELEMHSEVEEHKENIVKNKQEGVGGDP